MGDFNDILSKEEKEGAIVRTEASMSMLRDFVKNCGVLDLGFSGHPFTWWNKRSGKDAIKARPDRVFNDPQWSLAFHRASCFHLEMVGADHCPFLLDTEVKTEKSKRLFVFDSRWVDKDGCEDMVRTAWV
ncbi:hypothetical protein LIER_42843 [Lithospermum erythrorhizon]|uniref:Endonuclease/exonuclease/phosphatase n=1 Tax=Lithospermum erythrorhizon TaxID=34254 RepID=A0AAV3P242_LITER